MPELKRVSDGGTGQTLSLVYNTINKQRTAYAEMVTMTKHIRRVRALRLRTRTPKTFQKLIGYGVRNPLPWSLVQTICGMIAKGAPQFERIPLRPSERDKAATLAATCWPLIQTYDHMTRGKVSFYGLVDQLTGDGVGITKLRRSRSDDYPMRRRDDEGNYVEDADDYNSRVKEYLENPSTENVFTMSQIDSAIFWPDLDDVPQYVVEAGRKPLIPTLRSLGKRLGTNNAIIDFDAPGGTPFHEEMQPSGLGRNVDYAEVWTKDEVFFKMAGELYSMENELGFIPYAWRNGMTTSIPDPALQRVSTVFPFFALDPYINTVLTGLLSWGIMASMPTATIETDMSPGAQNDSQMAYADIPLGQMMTLPPGKHFHFQVPPAMGSEAVNVINMMLGFYDRAGVTSAARGNIGSRTPGLTFTSALEAAGDMVGPIRDAAANLLTDMCTMTWRAITALNMPMHVTGSSLKPTGAKGERARYTITPAMIGNYYDLSCELQAFSTQELIQRGMHSAFMLEKKLWSYERSSKFAGVENPEAERKEILLDEVRGSQLYKNKAMADALSDLPDATAEIEEAAAQGIDLLAPGTIDASAAMAGGSNHRPGMPAPASGGGRPQGMPRQPTGPGHNGAQPQER